jgi:hypothetical protein
MRDKREIKRKFKKGQKKATKQQNNFYLPLGIDNNNNNDNILVSIIIPLYVFNKISEYMIRMLNAIMDWSFAASNFIQN